MRHESYGHVYTSQRAELISTSADDFGRFATLSAARTFARGERDRLAGLLIKDNPVLFTGSKEDNS